MSCRFACMYGNCVGHLTHATHTHTHTHTHTCYLQVEKAEKEREKDRRLRVRTEKMAAQKKAQEDRINKSIERSKAPVQKKTGKPVMFRAPPLVTRQRDKDVREERNEDEEDLKEFLTE